MNVGAQVRHIYINKLHIQKVQSNSMSGKNAIIMKFQEINQVSVWPTKKKGCKYDERYSTERRNVCSFCRGVGYRVSGDDYFSAECQMAKYFIINYYNSTNIIFRISNNEPKYNSLKSSYFYFGKGHGHSDSSTYICIVVDVQFIFPTQTYFITICFNHYVAIFG